MANSKFLLIKAWGWGFWADMDHLIGQLLIAELTNRIPVACWGINSLYSENILSNAFELYFEPLSPFSLKDVAKTEHSFYPPIWNAVNIMLEDLDKITYSYRNLGDMMNSDADVLVSDVHYFARPIMEFIGRDHWMYGQTPLQIYRRLIAKYVHLKPDIQVKVDAFYGQFLKSDAPVLGVHVRGTDKIIEVANLPKLNRRYHEEIRKIRRFDDFEKMLVLTDSEEILNAYKKKYGTLVISTDAKRSMSNSEHNATQVEAYQNRRRKGVDVLIDTYLAAKCDYFIGNGYSNVSYSVNRLKEWPQSHITLLYNSLNEENAIARKRFRTERSRKQNQKLEHRLNYPELYGGTF